MKKRQLFFVVAAAFALLLTSCKNVFDINNSNATTGKISIRMPKRGAGKAARVADDEQYRVTILKLKENPGNFEEIENAIDFMNKSIEWEKIDPAELEKIDQQKQFVEQDDEGNYFIVKNLIYWGYVPAGNTLELEDLEPAFYGIYIISEDGGRYYYEGFNIAEVIAGETAEAKIIMKRHMDPIPIIRSQQIYTNPLESVNYGNTYYAEVDSNYNIEYKEGDIYSVTFEGVADADIKVAGFAVVCDSADIKISNPEPSDDYDPSLSQKYHAFAYMSYPEMFDTNIKAGEKFKLEKTMKILIPSKLIYEEYGSIPLKVVLLYHSDYCDKEVNFENVTYMIKQVKEEIPSTRSDYFLNSKPVYGDDTCLFSDPIETTVTTVAPERFQYAKIHITGTVEDDEVSQFYVLFNTKSLNDKAAYHSYTHFDFKPNVPFDETIEIQLQNYLNYPDKMELDPQLFYITLMKEGYTKSKNLHVKDLKCTFEYTEPKVILTRDIYNNAERKYAFHAQLDELAGVRKDDIYKFTLTGVADNTIPMLTTGIWLGNDEIAETLSDTSFVAGQEGKYTVTVKFWKDVEKGKIPYLSIFYDVDFLNKETTIKNASLSIEKVTKEIIPETKTAMFFTNKWGYGEYETNYLWDEVSTRNKIPLKAGNEYTITISGIPNIDIEGLSCKIAGINDDGEWLAITEDSKCFNLNAGKEFENTFAVYVPSVPENLKTWYFEFLYDSKTNGFEKLLKISNYYVKNTDSYERLFTEPHVTAESSKYGIKFTVTCIDEEQWGNIRLKETESGIEIYPKLPGDLTEENSDWEWDFNSTDGSTCKGKKTVLYYPYVKKGNKYNFNLTYQDNWSPNNLITVKYDGNDFLTYDETSLNKLKENSKLEFEGPTEADKTIQLVGVTNEDVKTFAAAPHDITTFLHMNFHNASDEWKDAKDYYDPISCASRLFGEYGTMNVSNIEEYPGYYIYGYLDIDMGLPNTIVSLNLFDNQDTNGFSYLDFEEVPDRFMIFVNPKDFVKLEIIDCEKWYSFVCEPDALNEEFILEWPFESLADTNKHFMIQAFKENGNYVCRDYYHQMKNSYNKNAFSYNFNGASPTYGLQNQKIRIGVENYIFDDRTMKQAIEEFAYNGPLELTDERTFEYQIQTVKEITDDGQWLNNYSIELTFDINDSSVMEQLYDTDVTFGAETILSLMAGNDYYGVTYEELNVFWEKLNENDYSFNPAGDYGFRTKDTKNLGEYRIPIFGDTELYNFQAN